MNGSVLQRNSLEIRPFNAIKPKPNQPAMIKTVFAGMLMLICSLSVYAQTGSSIKGQISDSVEKKNPANAVISLLRRSDSILIKFTRAEKDGHFSVNNVPSGRFILLAKL